MNHTHLLHSLLRGTRTPGRVLLEPEASYMVDRWVGGGDTSRRQAGSPIVEIYQMRKAETLFLEGARDKGRNSIG